MKATTTRSRKTTRHTARAVPASETTALGVDPLPDSILPDLDPLALASVAGDEQESRAFYKWLDAHWGNDGQMDQHPPTRFLLDELDERGDRIQKIGGELEQTRERMLEREVQIVRLESEAAEMQKKLAEMQADLDAQGERYRRALQSASESRRQTRELENEVERLRQQDHRHAEAVARLNAQMEELMMQTVALEHGAPVAAAATPAVDASMEARVHEAEMRVAEIEGLRRSEGDRYRELFGEKDNQIRNLQLELTKKEAENAHLHAEMSSWPVRHARSLGKLLGR